MNSAFSDCSVVVGVLGEPRPASAWLGGSTVWWQKRQRWLGRPETSAGESRTFNARVQCRQLRGGHCGYGTAVEATCGAVHCLRQLQTRLQVIVVGVRSVWQLPWRLTVDVDDVLGHVHKLIHQPLAVHFGENASLVIVPTFQVKRGFDVSNLRVHKLNSFSFYLKARPIVS